MVLPILRALQGSPEPGRLWEEHCNHTLMAPPLNFITAMHDKIIYQTIYKGERIFMLRQVDDFAMACDNEETAKVIYNIIGASLRLPKEDKDPFAYLGLIEDYNGIFDIHQARNHIKVSCLNYIDWIMTTHRWETSSNKDNIHSVIPLRSDVLNQLANEKPGPKEGTKEHRELQEKQGFLYPDIVRWDDVCAYVSCRPDIGYAITLMSKYGSNPLTFHYHCLKSIAKYLRTTKEWGIIFHWKGIQKEFPTTAIPEIPSSNHNLPQYPTDTTDA